MTKGKRNAVIVMSVAVHDEGRRRRFRVFLADDLQGIGDAAGQAAGVEQGPFGSPQLYTDIACGVNAGIDTVFVLSGEGTQADIAAYQIHPTWVYPDIGTLYRELEETV